MTDSKQTNNCDSCEETSACFKHLFPDELEFIKNKKKQITYFKGETLFKQGAFAPYVMYVVKGLVRVYLQTGAEKQISIRLAKAGDFLAFSSVFGESVYNYSAVSVKDSVICMIEKDGLHKLLLKNSDFAMRITSKNCRHESHLLEIVKNISYKQMRGKLASALLYLSSEEFEGEDVFSHLIRQDIADFASISVESTIKFLKEFEKEKLILLDGKDIKILEKEGVELISKNG